MIKFYEDYVVGVETTLGAHAFTREEIVAYALEFDPQPFHLDEVAGAASIFGSLCASGWHTASVAMRIIVDWRDAGRAECIARGEPVPPIGVSPGISNMRWPHPTRPGDVVTFRSRVESMRETRRPQWGLVGQRSWGINQEGREVLSFEGLVLVGRRGG